MKYEFQGFYIPERMMEALEEYIEFGTPPGGFLQAVFSNCLSDAVSQADDENIHNLPAFIGYLYNEAPSACWGSRETMKSWIAKHSKLKRDKAKLEKAIAEINQPEKEES